MNVSDANLKSKAVRERGPKRRLLKIGSAEMVK